ATHATRLEDTVCGRTAPFGLGRRYRNEISITRRRRLNAYADAILDRLVHNAYTINLKGESMRKKQANLTQADHSAQ
ncbi:MAG: ATP-binding protein, partial [Gammaproteobacteria bacterium]